MAYSANYKQVFRGEFPDIEINFPAFLVSMGSLSPTNQAVAELNGIMLTFSWNPALLPGRPGSGRDIAMFMVYNPDEKMVAYSLRAAERRAGQYNFELPMVMSFSPKILHTWVSFVSADGKQSSESRYVEVFEGE